MSATVLHIAARDVRVGDEYHHATPGSGPDMFGHRRLPESGWHRVRSVVTEGSSTRIDVGAWQTVKHPREGVTVRREVPS